MSFNFNKKRFLNVSVAIALIISFSACSSSNDNTTSNTQSDLSSASDTASTSTTAGDNGIETSSSGMFTERDLDASYDKSTAVSITLADNNIICNSRAVTMLDNTVTITDEGVYILTGALSNGRVVVDAEKTDKIQLVLDGVSINCNTTAPVYIRQADKVFVTLAEKSQNSLSNKSEFIAVDENNIDSVIFSKDDLTFNGTGQLNVDAKYGHGIVSKDDLVFTGGVYTVTAENHTLTGNDSIKIANGTFNLTAGKDGLQAENTDDTSKGIIYIENGNMNITSDGDGMDASSTLELTGGTINITTGGGSENAEQKQEEMFGRGGFDREQQSASQQDTTSVKGLKSGGDMNITGGTVTVNSVDDSLHSNSSISISGGNFEISSGDDGIHADSNVLISGGNINISNSYEGIEGQTIEISGGVTTLVASDDGLNSAGGNDESGFGGGMQQDIFAVDENSHIKITGGSLTVDASGDGIDSNGDIYISGGTAYVTGPSNSGNGTMDYASTAEITGGVFIGSGASGMAQNFSDSSTQGTMLVTTSMSLSDGEIVLKNSNGEELASFTPTREYNSVIVSCPDIKQGETYTLTANNTDTTVEMTSLVYGTGGMGGNPMGDVPQGGNSRGGNPMGDMQAPPDIM